jgi:VIT1/CCC1 family predicted Fe2+/Mn2+ transporter
MTGGHDNRRFCANLHAERDAARLYAVMAARERDPRLAEVYRRLEATELRHVAFWAERLRAAGAPVPSDRPSLRTRVMMVAARVFGNAGVAASLAASERAVGDQYAGQADAAAAGIAAEERSHVRVFEALAAPIGLDGATVARNEGRHRNAGGNALRAAVLGANDGLVSVFSLVMGVAGAGMNRTSTIVAGMAGLLAGAISMALGEWLSVQSARELYGHQVDVERDELSRDPAEEMEELVLIYQSKGVPEVEARRMVEHLFRDPQRALDTLVREELSLDPQELGGSAWVAAGTSFLLFAAGAIIPVFPFFFWSGWVGIVVSGVGSAIGLFAVGAGITLVTGRNAWYSGLRQVAIGAVAAAVTFGLGRIMGVNLS